MTFPTLECRATTRLLALAVTILVAAGFAFARGEPPKAPAEIRITTERNTHEAVRQRLGAACHLEALGVHCLGPVRVVPRVGLEDTGPLAWQRARTRLWSERVAAIKYATRLEQANLKAWLDAQPHAPVIPTRPAWKPNWQQTRFQQFVPFDATAAPDFRVWDCTREHEGGGDWHFSRARFAGPFAIARTTYQQYAGPWLATFSEWNYQDAAPWQAILIGRRIYAHVGDSQWGGLAWCINNGYGRPQPG